MKTSKSTNIPAEIIPDDSMFIPMYKAMGSSCVDLVANIPSDENGKREIKLMPRHVETIDCGFIMVLEQGWEAQIRSRSTLARSGIQAINCAIDNDRQRIQVFLTNIGREIVVIKHGDYVAQMSLKPVYKFQWKVIEKLNETDRKGGFGSTGI